MRPNPAVKGPAGHGPLGSMFFWGYWLIAIQFTFLNLHFKRVGLSGTEIGLLGAAFSMVSVLLSPFIAGRFDVSRRQPAFLAALSVLSGLFFWLLGTTSSFPPLLVITIALAVFVIPVLPIINSISLYADAAGTLLSGYGSVRRWGSIGFAVAGVAAGALARPFGLRVIFPLFAACAVILALLALRIRNARRPPSARPAASHSLSRLMRNRDFILLALVSMVWSLGGSMCWGFRSIYLGDMAGVPEYHIGLLWILPITAEVVVFSVGARLLGKFGGNPLIVVGALIGGARWWLLTSVHSLPAIYTVEILHGLAFAVYYMGAMSLMRRVVPPSLGATAQVIFNSSASGVGSVVGSWLGGILFDSIGVIPQLRIGGIALAAALLFSPGLWSGKRGGRGKRGAPGAP